jgi:hypothetical protein
MVSAASTPAAIALALLAGHCAAKQPRDDPALLRRACPDYLDYSQVPQ